MYNCLIFLFFWRTCFLLQWRKRRKTREFDKLPFFNDTSYRMLFFLSLSFYVWHLTRVENDIIRQADMAFIDCSFQARIIERCIDNCLSFRSFISNVSLRSIRLTDCFQTNDFQVFMTTEHSWTSSLYTKQTLSSSICLSSLICSFKLLPSLTYKQIAICYVSWWIVVKLLCLFYSKHHCLRALSTNDLNCKCLSKYFNVSLLCYSLMMLT